MSLDIIRDPLPRADLILFWSERRASHVEVKIGDESFDKTTATARSCEDTFADRQGWAHYVLLPDESREAWLESAIADPRVALDITPWWADATDARYLLNRALTMMWLEVRWRAPAIVP